MRTRTIQYSLSQESFDINTGLKSWKKAGVEIELEPNEHEDEAFAHAKEIISQQMNANNNGWSKYFSESPYESPTAVPSQPIINRAAEKTTKDWMIHDIQTCTELKVLETYKFIAKTDPHYQQAYDNQYKLLSQ